LVTVAVHTIAVFTGAAVILKVPLPEAPQLFVIVVAQLVVVVSVGAVGVPVSHCRRRPETAPAVSALNDAN
jgi:hypothetical protein